MQNEKLLTLRPSGRKFNELRKITLEKNVAKYAEGSCFIKSGFTHVLCTASIEERVPPWLRNTGQGWVTAEYGMIPRSTETRMRRESSKGKQTGRTQEIQRLIGRSLRSIVDLKLLGERQVTIDCDVIQADGGTRTAAITGSYVALHEALTALIKKGELDSQPINNQLAAISCGIYKGEPILDLDYQEDSEAEVDANFVMTNNNQIIEIQTTAESNPFSEEKFNELFNLAKKGIYEITKTQEIVLGI